jgi:hypothetical protein
MDGLIKDKTFENNVFAFYFNKNDVNQSKLDFGQYDKTKFKGDLAWNDVIYKQHYVIKFDDVKINGKALGLCGDGKDNKCSMMVDSGA